MTVELKDLGTAFRKAKVDLYYSTNSSLFAIADYEENLEENLQRLQKQINGRPTAWAKEPGFLGTWTLVPKAIKSSEEKDYGLTRAAVEDQWACNSKAEGKRIHAKSGNHDYCITVEIAIVALHQFQSCHRSPSEGFKPVTDGFAVDMSKDRKVLPKGGE